MSAQAQIQSTRFVGGPDFDLAGIQLLPANTPEHQGEVKQVLADDADLVAPLLPYSVLVVNHSGRKLLGVGVDYHWPGLHGQLRGSAINSHGLNRGRKAKHYSGRGNQVVHPLPGRQSPPIHRARAETRGPYWCWRLVFRLRSHPFAPRYRGDDRPPVGIHQVPCRN
jgi:hypothetical protein